MTLAAGCSRDGGPGAAAAAISLTAPRTTSAVVAVKNLDAEIAAREQRAGDAIADEQIVGFYESRSQFLGRISDLVAALDASARALAARPGDPAAHLARA
ncbi:MAG: hypothetical protein FWD17_10995, partial [Polyangiaceae bacterium]|nr:hypothetical protein [Polyangiaceae bacterium]